MFVLLKVGCTLPVTSCECERSFSAMGGLRNWLRRSMKTERLTFLALINIHHDIAVDYDEVARLIFQLWKKYVIGITANNKMSEISFASNFAFSIIS